MSANPQSPANDALPQNGTAFPTTCWSMILRAGSTDERARSALETLCGQYWYPLYGFTRRHGRTHHEAEDLTQAFLVRLLSADGVARARPERGRFRTFLLSGLRHFLINEWHRERTAKRGGGIAPLSLDFDTAEQRFSHEPADPKLSPEQAFDRNWARGMIDQVLCELRAEYEKSGRGAVFAVLGPLVWGHAADDTLEKHAASLRMNNHALTVALHRLRRRLGERLREAVASTVANDEEIDDELRYLIASSGSGRA